jgi:hypothetical protein
MTAVDWNSPKKAEPPAGAVMLTILEIALRDGVSKQAVSQNVRRWLRLERGIFVERNGHGTIIAVNVKDYDRLHPNGNPARDAHVLRQVPFAGEPAVALTAAAAALRDVQVVAIQLLDRLPSRAAALTNAALVGGESSVRALLKTIAIDLRAEAVGAWEELAGKGRALAAAVPFALQQSEAEAISSAEPSRQARSVVDVAAGE